MLDLSHNFFQGNLPITEIEYGNLTILRLNDNQFSGTISTEIGKLTSLNELMLCCNELRGSIPSQIGNLRNMSKLSLSNNFLKGTLVSDLSNLKKLELLHVHRNRIEGSVDFFNYSIKEFVADCGRTETSKPLLTCSTCSTCCNDEGSCINTSKTWPSGDLKYLRISPTYLVILFVMTGMVALSCCFLLVRYFDALPPLPFEARIGFQKASAYRFLLSNNKFLQFIALLAFSFQIWIIITFHDRVAPVVKLDC